MSDPIVCCACCRHFKNDACELLADADAHSAARYFEQPDNCPLRTSTPRARHMAAVHSQKDREILDALPDRAFPLPQSMLPASTCGHLSDEAWNERGKHPLSANTAAVLLEVAQKDRDVLRHALLDARLRLQCALDRIDHALRDTA